MPLAVTSYENLTALQDSDALLNLAWTLDERACLAADVVGLVTRELAAEITEDRPYRDRYLVQDPYGEQELQGALAGFFDTSFAGLCVTCGAGAISLLHGLAHLAAQRPAYIIGDIYPDFPEWVERNGSRCVSRALHPAGGDHAANIRAAGASVVLLERPSLIGNEFEDLRDLRKLCDALAPHNVTVIVDESYANYYPSRFSAVNLLSAVENLIVVRGLSKAYWLGALRLAYCITPASLREQVRSVIPPLLASSISLRIGRKVLELGDIAAPLRERISDAKAEMLTLLDTAGLTTVLPANRYLPYVFLPESDRQGRAQLERCGVLGKPHLVWSQSTEAPEYLYRLSAPLRRRRMQQLQERLGRIDHGDG
jgi:histidinol-phosphate/aromatic aminotransferase/cobyric acid decarboxylase-like protein